MDYDKVKEAAVAILALVDPRQPYGTVLFNAIARVSVTMAVEAVVVQRNSASGRLEVLMTQRGPDEAYPGQWHAPGSVFRPFEYPDDVFLRLAKREFGAGIRSATFVGCHFYSEWRGWYQSLVYLVELDGESKDGRFFSVDELPSETVIHHRDTVIPMAVRAFEAREG